MKAAAMLFAAALTLVGGDSASAQYDSGRQLAANDTLPSAANITINSDACVPPVLRPDGSGELVSHDTFGRCAYPPGTKCNWTVPANLKDSFSRLEFTFLDYEMPLGKLPCEDSYLRFYDGNDTSKAPFNSFCHGREIPTSFKSSSNLVTIEFQGLSGFLTGKGFKLKWEMFRDCRPTGDFICDNGQCIDEKFKCDGRNGMFGCSDGSDEASKLCPVATCAADETPCAHKFSCYKKLHKCDGFSDCNDDSDEVGCKESTCGCGEERCANKFGCYNITTQKCNGVKDCRDGSDENCPQVPCANYENQCAHNFSCYNKQSQKCNGVRDCNDGTDEAGCTVAKCSIDQYHCAHKFKCIPFNEWCDGTKHCNDGSDEKNCDPSHAYVGCYENNPKESDMTKVLKNDKMTIRDCFLACKKKRNIYFALQGGNECWCGDAYAKYSRKEGFYCNMKCAGETFPRKCGGTNHYDVRTTGLKKNTFPG